MKHRKMFVACILLAAILATVAVTAAAAAGTGPDDALAPSGDWAPLQPGAELWYGFHYKGDGSQVDVRLEVVPAEGAAFAVWTPEAIDRWRRGLEAGPVGRGSPAAHAAGVLVWSGSFTTKGNYYVVVEHSGGGTEASYYLLEIEGDGVSLAPSAPAMPPPQPTSPKPAPAAPAVPAAPATMAGRLIFQTSLGGPIYTIDVDGQNLQRVGDGMDPTWSPDGQQFAFIRWTEPRGVWVANADGSGARRVFDWSEPRWTSWSPNGQQVLFSRPDGGRTTSIERCFRGWCFTIPANPHWKLGVVRPGDGSFYEPPASNYSRAPDWSPAGGRLVYADEQGLRVQSEDGAVSYLITDDARDTSPIWSPDGSRIAFVRRQHDHWEIYLVDADGRNLRRLTDTPFKPNGEVANSVSPAWSPDGTSLAFLTDRTGRWEIWRMRANGTNPQPMFETALDGLVLDYGFVGERAISWTE